MKILYNLDSFFFFYIFCICKFGFFVFSIISFDFFFKNIYYLFLGFSEVRMLFSNNFGRDGGSEYFMYVFLREMLDFWMRVEVEFEEIILSFFEKR